MHSSISRSCEGLKHTAKRSFFRVNIANPVHHPREWKANTENRHVFLHSVVRPVDSGGHRGNLLASFRKLPNPCDPQPFRNG